MSRSTYVQRTIRNTLISEKSFKETLDTFLYGTFTFTFEFSMETFQQFPLEVRFFQPIHPDKMIEQAMEAKDPKIFDELASEASGRFGYL